MVLGDLGADVIKVERPGVGDDTRRWGPPWVGDGDGAASAYYLCTNRNKRSIEADLGDAASRELIRELALEADVLVENFAPGTMERWGMGYDDLAAANPRLVFCTITGYGSDGPDAGKPGYDFALQAWSGWMSITGEPAGEPVKVGVAVVDVLTGQNAAIGILAALRERDRSGRGQRVEAALVDSALAGLVNVAQAALSGAAVTRHGNAHPTIVPYESFRAADGPLVIAVGNDAQWGRLCEAMELAGLAADPRFASNPDRVANRDALRPLLAERVRERTVAQWMDALEQYGVPCAPVRTVQQAVSDVSIRERGGIWRMMGDGYGEVDTIANPVRFSRTPAMLTRAAPGLGEHNEQIAALRWGAERKPEQ
jgi:crotonobetainyl-CoA:carnitine CoA-transferase CaiB-like acyl-CoA transferase